MTVSPEIKDKVIALSRGGSSVIQIMQKTDLSGRTIRRLLLQRDNEAASFGGSDRRPRWTQYEVNRLVEMFNKGLSCESMAAEIGRSPSSVLNRLANLGLYFSDRNKSSERSEAVLEAIPESDDGNGLERRRPVSLPYLKFLDGSVTGNYVMVKR
jgi:hypothetical protein